MTFAQLVPLYLRHLAAERDASPYTIRNYDTDLDTFRQFLDEVSIRPEVEAVTRNTVRSYLAWLMEKGFARSSIRRKKSVLGRFYAFLVRETVVTGNPAASISSPKAEKRLPEFLSIDEARRLVEAPDTSTPLGLRDRALLELLYASGLRVSEVVSLDKDQVRCDDRQFTVLGKGSKERLALMGGPAAEALTRYLNEGRPHFPAHEKTGALFINRYGKRMAQRRVQYLIDEYARKIGLLKRVHPHLIRHTFATHLLDGNADLRVVQELMGHSQLSSTEVYTHVTQSKARKVYLAAHPRAREQ